MLGDRASGQDRNPATGEAIKIKKIAFRQPKNSKKSSSASTRRRDARRNSCPEDRPVMAGSDPAIGLAQGQERQARVGMGWNRWYAARSYVRTSLWIVPLLALVLEQITIRIVASIGDRADWVPLIGTTVEATLGAMDTVITLTISFIVFAFGSMLVAIQVAGGQLTRGSSRRRCCVTM